MSATAELSKAVTAGVSDKVSQQLSSALENAAHSVDSAARSLRQTVPTSTREQIIDAAGQVFAEKGFASASLDEVAKRAGRTKGAIYSHFASKDELMMALIEENDVSADCQIDELLNAYVAGSFPQYMDQVLASTERSYETLLSTEILSYAIRNQHAHGKVADIFALQKDRLEQQIKKRIPHAADNSAIAFACLVNMGAIYGALNPKLVNGETIYQLLRNAIEPNRTGSDTTGG